MSQINLKKIATNLQVPAGMLGLKFNANGELCKVNENGTETVLINATQAIPNILANRGVGLEAALPGTFEANDIFVTTDTLKVFLATDSITWVSTDLVKGVFVTDNSITYPKVYEFDGVELHLIASINWGDFKGAITDQTDLVTYINERVAGLWDDRGNYDASGNVYPSTGGSGTAGAVLKSDIWLITVGGVLNGEDVLPGQTVRALIDNPGQTDANWAISKGGVIVGSSGGPGSRVYLTNLTSTIVGTYKQVSNTNDITTTTESTVVNNNEVLIKTYLFESPVEVSIINAGQWLFDLFAKVSSTSGVSQLKVEIFSRTEAGVETVLFSKYSNEINNTDYTHIEFETEQPVLSVSPTSRMGIRVYAKTTHTANVTVSYQLGDDTASYFTTPLPMRHRELRALNGDSDFLHVTQTNINTWNNILPTTIAYQAEIPFTRPLTIITGKSLTTNDTLTIGANPVEGYGAQTWFDGDGSHSPVLTNFDYQNGTYDSTSGTRNLLTFEYIGGKSIVSILNLTAV